MQRFTVNYITKAGAPAQANFSTKKGMLNFLSDLLSQEGAFVLDLKITVTPK